MNPGIISWHEFEVYGFSLKNMQTTSEEYADEANVGANDVMKMQTTIEEVDGDKGTDESLDDNYIVGDDYW